MSGSGAGPAPGWWRCRALDADGTPRWFATVWSSRYADDVEVDLPEAAAVGSVGADAVAVARFDDRGHQVIQVEVTPLSAPSAPPLWFLELRESASRPPAVHLVAFTGHGVDAGAVLDEAAAREVGVATADQLGALRWYPASGEVDQVYVNPAWRRRSIGSGLVAAGTTLATARGWARFWGDGQRTELGERFRRGSAWAHRAAPLTHLAPPMTPGAAADRDQR